MTRTCWTTIIQFWMVLFGIFVRNYARDIFFKHHPDRYLCSNIFGIYQERSGRNQIKQSDKFSVNTMQNKNV